ncbi:ankyrin unc44 [Colletotrichum incanum]|uniref:Ankyrin unc44 n=1 Tax=Colletotrichum incanum TaxID=1573173 RepID=A0A161WJW4_COLIC|nr:ankyrin unc44 [Colletotrichum incanum]
MIIPSLEIVYPAHINLAPPGWRPQVNIICIHDLGGSPKTTWHHDESGKTWISDPDFLGSFKDSVRVWTYGYNSEPAANMMPASVALHADELLASMMEEYTKYSGGPTIFVAHGLGGTIVKKAVELYTRCPEYFIIKDLTAGIVFLDTIHHPTDSKGVLKAVKTTVTASLAKHSLNPSMDEIRQFSEAVREVNSTFVDQTMPRFLILNCHAMRSIKLTAADGTSFKARVVPKGRGEIDSVNVKNVLVDCNHFELTQISSPLSQTHILLAENIAEMISNISAQNKKMVFFSISPPVQSKTANPRPPPPGPKKPGKSAKVPGTQFVPGPPQRDKNTESFHLWIRKQEAENMKRCLDTLLNKLGTWDQTHLGYDISPMPGTCTWIQSDPVFQDWLKSNKTDDVYVCGRAGSGKTYLAKSIANYLVGDRPRPASLYDNIVLSFFCNVSTTGNKKPPILEYFIKALLRSPLWFESLSSHFWYLHDDGKKLDLGSLFEILRQFMTRAQLTMGPPRTTEVFLIVDGLQECDVAYVREFVQLVGSLVDKPAPRILPPSGPVGPMQYFARETVRFKFFFTHTPNEIMFLASSRAFKIDMTDENVKKDMSKYVDKEAGTIFTVKNPMQSPEAICEWIKSESGCFFFYAKYSLQDSIATVRDGDDYGYSINARPLPCPEQLGKYYDYELLPLFQSIDNQNYALSTLHIVISAKRFVNREEVRDAIACLHDDPRLSFLNIQSILWQKCSRLINVDKYLELFVSHQSLCLHFSSYLSKEQQHANMAFLCLKYLLQPMFGRDCRINSSELSGQHPFYNYAACWWEEHFRLSNREGMKLLPQVGRFITSSCYKTWSSYQSWNSATNQWARKTPMYRAIMSNPWIPPAIALTNANVGHLTRELQTTYSLIDSESWSWKDEAMTLIKKILHKLDAYPGMAILRGNSHLKLDYSVRAAAGHTALMIAAMAPDGLPDMIEFFAQRTQHINERSFVHGETALLLLCRYLDTGDDLLTHMMSLLLDAGADPNISGFDGKTCLLEACERNSLTMVRILLRAGASPDSSTLDGFTPLREALMNSNRGIVETLIDCDVDQSLKFPSPNDQIPLTFVIAERNFDLFRLLLYRSDDINQLDGAGFAAIHLLTAPEYIDWLSFLLERPDVDLDLLSDGLNDDHTGLVRRTPLCFAIFHDNFKAVEMLLEAGASPCRHPETTDGTPLYMAVRLARTTRNKKGRDGEDEIDNTGNVDIVELLLAYQSPINTLNHKSKRYAKSPLMLAVYLKDQNMVELLLQHGADPTLEEAYGLLGPLDAAIDDDEEIGLKLVKTLLDNPLPPSINYVSEDNDETDHILIETSGKKPALVRLLLDYGADTKCFLSPTSGHAMTPLLSAVKENNIDTCKVLMQHEPDLVNFQSAEGLVCEAPIHMAAREGYTEIVRCLLDAGAQPDLLSYHWQETPLWSACYRGRLEIAQLLYHKAPETLNTPSHDGNTPLIVACGAGNPCLVKFLLEKGADINARCSMGRSCVCSAVSEDNGAAHKIIDQLIQHGLGINDVVSAVGFTVLGEACKAGDAQTVRMLLEKGADPSRGQKSPGNTSTAWRSALRVAVISGHAQVVDILLQHPQLASFIENVDYYGENALHMDSPTAHADASEITIRLYRACQRLKSDTGIDHFQRMLTVKNRELHTPVDVAVGRLHGILSVKALANIDETICQYVVELTAGDGRTIAEHKHLLKDLSVLLLQRGGYDQQAVRLLQTLILGVEIKEEDGRFIDTAACTVCCDGCDEDEQEIISFCRSCRINFCQNCVSKNEQNHELVGVPVVKDRSMMDFNSEEIDEGFAILARDFVIERKPVFQGNVPVASFEVDPDSDETALSLASLHAFGYLEFQRRAWSPYLPLAPAVYKRIRPWEPMIEQTRRDFQEWVWDTETFPFRLRSELRYFLEAGRKRAYKDLETIQRDQVMRDVAWLFVQKERFETMERFPTLARGPKQMEQLDDLNW